MSSFTPQELHRRTQPWPALVRAATGLVLAAALPACNGDDGMEPGPGPATQIAFSQQPTNQYTGDPFDPVVQVELRDANGNVAVNDQGQVSIAVGTNPNAGTLMGTTTVSAVDGVASFPGISIDQPGRGYALRASSDGMSATSDRFNLTVPAAYVTEQFDNAVTVIDTRTNTVITVVSVGNPRAVAVTPDGTFAYVANRSDGTVSVIETANNTVVATVTVGTSPDGMAIRPDGAFAYLPNQDDNTVSVIETAGNTVTATISVGGGPDATAVTPNGAFVYVTNNTDGTVSVIETASNTVTATVTVGNAAENVAITPDGAMAYVTNFGDGTVSVIATATNTVTATVTVGAAPADVAVAPDGSFVYVTNNGDGTVSVIETAGNTVTQTIALIINFPWGVAFTPDGAFAYVVSSLEGVAVIDTGTHTLSTTIAGAGLGGGPELDVVPAPVP
jgi:YVTN family beta-propeller protein